MTITPSSLLRTAGLAAAASGLLFALIQFIHPVETVAAVETPAWVWTHVLGVLMCALGIVGVAGIYLRQVRETGVLGLAGALLLTSFFGLTGGFQFVEAFVVPELADDAPGVVTNLLAMSTGGDTGDLGAVAAIAPITGALYLIGGVVFAVALYRARIVARWASVLLAVGTVVTLAVPAVPHSVARMFAFPVAVALIGLGVSLWRDRRPSTAPAAAPAWNAA
jgi:hypothetical protein